MAFFTIVHTTTYFYPQRSYARYRAISQAAAHIEAHPHLYSFDEVRMDQERRCMLGRIGAIYGVEFVNADQVAPEVLGISASHFFWEIGALILKRTPNFNGDREDFATLSDPLKVAPALRQLAERYRPREIGLPACVTEIFSEENDHAVV